jgi:hypothetical protein
LNILSLLQASKGSIFQCFYSLPEFQEWKEATDNWHTWKIKYYKGLHVFFPAFFLTGIILEEAHAFFTSFLNVLCPHSAQLVQVLVQHNPSTVLFIVNSDPGRQNWPTNLKLKF